MTVVRTLPGMPPTPQLADYAKRYKDIFTFERSDDNFPIPFARAEVAGSEYVLGDPQANRFKRQLRDCHMETVSYRVA